VSRAKCIMVQGTMSGAGKSLLCAALCRIFAQDGYRAAPFKSQNMALNSHVTRDGLEMGRAQAVQAQAAGVEPDVRMNPVLLKPSSDTGSQVIVLGEVRGHMSAAEYFRYKRQLFPEVLAAYDSLAAEHDVIVIEGAGSPAEINLRADDIVNMGLALRVGAPVLLAGDIDRGGVFAQLYGTVALLQPEERERIAGLVINKFRGDLEILRPGLSLLEEKTGKRVLGVVPYLKVDVDDEDSLAPCLGREEAHKPLDAAVIRLPRISNFTDFAPFERYENVSLRYVAGPRDLHQPDLILLPGTKSTISDLRWLRQCGLEAAVLKAASAGTPVMGICGGYQMLGRTIRDPEGVEGGGGRRGRGEQVGAHVAAPGPGQDVALRRQQGVGRLHRTHAHPRQGAHTPLGGQSGPGGQGPGLDGSGDMAVELVIQGGVPGEHGEGEGCVHGSHLDSGGRSDPVKKMETGHGNHASFPYNSIKTKGPSSPGRSCEP